MTQEEFDALLALFDMDRERAGELYEQVRRKITRYFDMQGCPDSDECADRTMQRVARKLTQGADIRPPDPYAYFRGVAHFILMEYWKERGMVAESVEDLTPARHPAINPKEVERQRDERLENERALACLETCLKTLPEESARLFAEYHREEQGRSGLRSALAANRGIDIVALRTRVTRIRARLEHCINACLREKS